MVIMNIKSNLIEAHIIRKTNIGLEFLLMKRAPDKIYAGVWQMVTGRVKKNEKASRCHNEMNTHNRTKNGTKSTPTHTLNTTQEEVCVKRGEQHSIKNEMGR